MENFKDEEKKEIERSNKLKRKVRKGDKKNKNQ